MLDNPNKRQDHHINQQSHDKPPPLSINGEKYTYRDKPFGHYFRETNDKTAIVVIGLRMFDCYNNIRQFLEKYDPEPMHGMSDSVRKNWLHIVHNKMNVIRSHYSKYTTLSFATEVKDIAQASFHAVQYFDLESKNQIYYYSKHNDHNHGQFIGHPQHDIASIRNPFNVHQAGTRHKQLEHHQNPHDIFIAHINKLSLRKDLQTHRTGVEFISYYPLTKTYTGFNQYSMYK